jgi:signal transduction histidine kinase
MSQQTPFSLEHYRDNAREALLEIFASANQLPIGLFEERRGKMARIASRSSLDDLEEPYCKAIKALPKGRKACARDECLRARRVIGTGQEKLTLCHAGLYSQAIPITVDGVTRAVLMYGEMRVADEERERRSLQNHERAMELLAVPGPRRDGLRQLLLQTKQFSPADLERVRATLPRVGAWLYRLFDEEDRLERRVEKVTHELQIRLQPVLANAEILYYDLQALSGLGNRYKLAANEVLNSAMALSTVVQNMGEFLEEHHYTRGPIVPLLEEAQRIYGAEAARRAVDIQLHVEPLRGREPTLEISADHLQYAFNNLVHNAVKYSFRGGPGRRRYVRIDGRTAGRYYAIAIENYGVGILAAEIEEGLLFQEGYQGLLTRGEYRTGAGKGLHFANQIVERHHGRIEVSSIPKGDGTESREGQPHLNRFVVYLPYKQPAA